jgi:hypothetical protein
LPWSSAKPSSALVRIVSTLAVLPSAPVQSTLREHCASRAPAALLSISATAIEVTAVIMVVVLAAEKFLSSANKNAHNRDGLTLHFRPTRQ